MTVKYSGPGGKRYNSAADMMNDMAKSALKEGMDKVASAYDKFVRDKLAGLACPVHGSKIEQVTTTRQGDEMTFAIDACCSELNELAEKTIANATAEGQFKI